MCMTRSTLKVKFKRVRRKIVFTAVRNITEWGIIKQYVWNQELLE